MDMPVSRKRCAACERWGGSRALGSEPETVAIASETDTGPCQGGPWNGSERRARMACGHWLRWTALGPDPATP